MRIVYSTNCVCCLLLYVCLCFRGGVLSDACRTSKKRALNELLLLGYTELHVLYHLLFEVCCLFVGGLCLSIVVRLYVVVRLGRRMTICRRMLLCRWRCVVVFIVVSFAPLMAST